MGAHGRFVWHDLMTTDLERAKGFYTDLFGWRYEIADMGELGQYTMIYAGERGIGGMVPFEALHGVPSHWMAYVTVADLDAAMVRVTAAGGNVCVPPTTIPNAGRFAVVDDPTGAVISPYVHGREEPAEEEGPPAAGTVCWNELLSTDAERARPFYQSLFGWGHGTMDMGPAGVYHLFKRDGKDVAGMMQMPKEAISRSLWMLYFAAVDVDAVYTKAIALGASGHGHVAPQDVPGVGRFATLGDPTGAAFGLFQRQSD